jgi:O-antigen/teichoic acid export membrane protein
MTESARGEVSTNLPLAVGVARGASYLAVQSILTAGVSVVAFAYTTRMLSQAEIGVMAAFLVVVQVCQLIATLGLPSASTKFLAELLGRGELGDARGVAYTIFLVNAILSAGVAFSLLVASTDISKLLLKTSDYSALFRALAFNVGLASMLPTLSSAIIGLQRIKESALINMACSALSSSLMVVLLAVGQGLLGVVTAWTIANAFNVILSAVLAIKVLGLPRGRLTNPLPRLLRYSWPLYVGDFLAFGYNEFDRILLLAYLPLSDLGVYNVVLVAFGVLASVPTAMTRALFPHYSELQGKDGVKSLENAVWAASRYTTYVLLPLAVGLAATSFPTMTLFAGQAYERGGYSLVILSLFQAAAVFGVALDGILLTLEKTVLQSAVIACSVAPSLILGIIVLPNFGFNGLAAVRGISIIIIWGLTVLAAQKTLTVRLDTEALAKAWIAALTMAALVISVELVSYHPFLLPIYVIVGATTYLIMLRILRALRPYDMHLIEVFLGRRGQRFSRLLSRFLVPSRTN